MSWCNIVRRRFRRPEPIDTSGLNALTKTAKKVRAQYESLIPTDKKDTTMTSANPNPAQADIDTDVAAIEAVFTSLGQVFTDLQTQLAALPASVDTSGLDALVATGQSTLSEFQAIDTVNPPAPPAGS